MYRCVVRELARSTIAAADPHVELHLRDAATRNPVDMEFAFDCDTNFYSTCPPGDPLGSYRSVLHRSSRPSSPSR
jgi:hypothetical protein